MRLRTILPASAILLAAPVHAQDHHAHGSPPVDHSAMDHSAHQSATEATQPQVSDASSGSGEQSVDHSAHQPASTPGSGTQDHAEHEEPSSASPATSPPKGHEHHAAPAASPMDHSAHSVMTPSDAAPPAPALSGPPHAADAIYGAAAMAAAREQIRASHGGMKTGTVMAERLEARLSDGRDAYLWDVQGWYGGDIDKLVLKTEGEGIFRNGVDHAEVQLLWGHALSPFFDLQAGVRLDLEPETRSHAVLGIQGLAPYMIHLDAAAFLSDRGDLTASIEGEHDWKLTQRLILQPRAEVALAAQDIQERGIGAGISGIEAGLRLRYELARELAPYIGIGYEAKLGETADIARAAGEDADGLAFLVGLRTWF